MYVSVPKLYRGFYSQKKDIFTHNKLGDPSPWPPALFILNSKEGEICLRVLKL